MKSWLALVLAPSVALATQGVLYALVTPACSTQTRLQIHLVAAVGLAVVVVLAVVAFGEAALHRGEPGCLDSDEGLPPVRRRFLATVASAVAGLAALVILGMWFATWVLSPCDP